MATVSFIRPLVIATDEAARIFIELAEQSDRIEDVEQHLDVSRMLENGRESLRKGYSR